MQDPNWKLLIPRSGMASKKDFLKKSPPSVFKIKAFIRYSHEWYYFSTAIHLCPGRGSITQMFYRYFPYNVHCVCFYILQYDTCNPI
jgi:hypothetical protein